MFDGNKFTSILNVAPQLRDRTLLVNGVSKVFAMIGWRVGYSAGPKHLLDGINTIQGQSTTPACSVSQAASLAALTGPKDFIMHRAASFQNRRDTVVSALTQAEDISIVRPQGAFYVYPECSRVIGRRTPEGRRISSDMDFCAWLLETHHVSTVPGVAFGLSPHFRISSAASEINLQIACQRIVEACSVLED